MSRISLCLCLCLVAVLLATEGALASVLAIDYGTDWIKASLMRHGVPFDVLLNRDSKRKIQSIVGWKGTDRLFGTDAFNIAARFPRDSFSSLKFLQGQQFSADAASFYASISTAKMFETTRKTVGLRKADDSEWTVEELIAMQFSYVKDLAESVANDRDLDVVVTVPPFYSQFERQAVLDAVEIAGLRPIALINDGTAIAINYAMTRTFQTPENHIIYDAGAGSIRATLVTFSTVPSADNTTISTSKSKGNTTTIEVKAIGYARNAGGNELDRRLRELMISDFELKHHKDIRQDARGLTKLWKEAGRVKTVLSANAEASAAVESLAFDIDYRAKISRTTFEESLTNLKSTFAQPIVDVLSDAGLTLDNITSVILAGGSSRTPIVQQSVRAMVGEAKIAQNVNADEAAVLGAAFYGAIISRHFKTKDIKVHEILLFDVQVSYNAESKSSASQPRTINTLLFPAGSKYGSKKTLTLKRKEDFTLIFSYKASQPGVFPSLISQAEIIGVAEALENLTERGASDPVIKVTMMLSDSGFAVTHDAVAFGEIKDDSIAGKLKGLFGGASSSEGSPLSNSITDPSDVNVPSPSPSTRKKQAALTDEDPSTIRLKVDVAPLSIHPLTYEEKRVSRDKLIAVDQMELNKRRREEARNMLETHLYRLRDLLDGDNSVPFITYSKVEEREKLSALLEETFHWLSEAGESAQSYELRDKREILERLEIPIQTRYKEAETIVPAVADLEQAHIAANSFLESARQNHTMQLAVGAPTKYTVEEIEDVARRLNESMSWLQGKSEKQKGLARHEDPVLLTSEVKARGMALQSHVMQLLKRKVSKAKKTKKSEATAQEFTTSSEKVETPVTTTTETTEVPVTTGVPDDSIPDHDEL